MADIQTLLKKIMTAVYGKDVRQSIHDAIHQCYEDGKAGNVDLEAREDINMLTTRVENIISNASDTGNNAELIDIRTGFDGVVYESAGKAVREQVKFISDDNYRMNQSAMTEVLQNRNELNVLKSKGNALKLELDSVTKGVESAFREIEINRADVVGGITGEGTIITMECVEKGIHINPNTTASIDNKFELLLNSAEDHYLAVLEVNAGDVFTVGKDFIASSNFPYVIVTDSNGIVTLCESFTTFLQVNRGYGGRITIAEKGFVYISARFDESTDELFVIERNNPRRPLVLDADMLASYNTDPAYGDEALEAILNGRQIVVRVPNASGDDYVATYSPIYMYQIPNKENNYLYLFYLKDEKQTVDLSALGVGTIQIPVYGELKMLLSKEYNGTPLV